MMKLGLFAVLLTVAAIPAAFAQPGSEVRSVDVYTGDLNLADPRDRHEAAWRVDHATRIACAPSPDVRALDDVRDYRGCRADAFDDAINDLETHRAHHRRGHVRTREYLPGR